MPSRLSVVAAVVCALVWAGRADAQASNLRLRIEWGGGTAQQWHTKIAIDRGSLSDPTPLGLEPDVPGSIRLTEKELVIAPRIARTYDGVDVLVTAPFEAVLTIEILRPDQPTQVFRKDVILSSVLSKYETFSIDEEGNALLIRRSPGDQLRVEFDRDNLVFSPAEQLTLKIEPHWAGLSADSEFNCNVEVYRSHTSEQIWTTQRRLTTDSVGNPPSIDPVHISLPENEGVYDVVVQLVPNRRFASPFARLKPAIERKLQLVVVSDQPNTSAKTDWIEQLVIDPAFPRWWDRIKQLPQLKWITGYGSPLGNEKSRILRYAGQDLVELEVDGWQAYPLPINEIGSPHIFEIEYPSNIPQTLGISVVEPNATGSVVPLGIDSGVDVQPSFNAELNKSRLLTHRIVVWPKTSSPLLLLTNQRRNGPAVFGKIRLLKGPTTLPPAEELSDSDDARMVATYFDRPLFPEVFGAREALDDWSQQTCDDWRTFFEGGRRLTEYLQFVGYNAAIVSVFSDGATIYPSQLLQPTARYDRGVFFVSGQDPVRKDVLEMLLRLFDRQGLQLIPALRFSTPLPEVEAMLRLGDGTGIELVNERGATWTQENGTQRGKAAYYNPLDPRVQDAMINVVAEIADKYGHHPSLAGVLIQLGPETYAQLPGELWGLDDHTIKRFESESSVKVPGQGPGRFEARGQFLRDDERGAKVKWISWRAEQLAKLYSTMSKKVARRNPDAKLYLSAADSMNSPEIYAALYPTLPRRTRGEVAQALRRIGIDAELYRDRPNLVLMRPQQIVPAASTAEAPLSVDLAHAPQMDRVFADAQHQSVQFSHVPRPRGLPSFEQRSPFGQDKTQIWMVPHVSPSGMLNRRRFVQQLATRDLNSILDGGWMPLLGQEAALRDLFLVFRNLPDGKFETVLPASEETPVHGVVIRRLTDGDKTYVYLVNDSPWRASVDISLESLSDCQVTSLSGRTLAQPVKNDEGEVRWSIELMPYDLVGAWLDNPAVRIIDWSASIPDNVAEQLKRRLTEIESRINGLPDPPPLNVISNAGFEAPLQGGSVVGWKSPNAEDIDGISISVDSEQSHSGQQSLRQSVTKKNRVAWVRSQPFPRPKTGRLAVSVWIKTEDPQQHPPLRLAIEGLLNARTYYSFTEIELTADWQPIIFVVNNLPPQGLTDLRVGFDLMGPGTVWIDDVQVFDRWFKENERDELIKDKGFARFQLDQGKVVKCYRFLESYWARFLLEHIPAAPRVAQLPAPKPTPPPTPTKKSPTMMDRVKRWLPGRIFRF